MTSKPFSHSVRADGIPAGGRHVRIEADAAERGGLAEALGIPEVAALVAELVVRPAAGRAFSVRGTLTAFVMQTDVVTLEPVSQEVLEDIDVTLVRAEDAAPVARRRDARVDPAKADAADFYRNGRIDLGSIVREHLALGLDPYPRAAGVDFTGHLEADPESGALPFAALGKLKAEDD